MLVSGESTVSGLRHRNREHFTAQVWLLSAFMCISMPITTLLVIVTFWGSSLSPRVWMKDIEARTAAEPPAYASLKKYFSFLIYSPLTRVITTAIPTPTNILLPPITPSFLNLASFLFNVAGIWHFSWLHGNKCGGGGPAGATVVVRVWR